MAKVSFPIYEPDGKKFHLTPDWIVFGLLFLSIGFFWLFDGPIMDNSVRPIWTLIMLILILYYVITSFFKYKPLNGILDGMIEFDEDQIKVPGQIFKLSDIVDIQFRFYDYYGKGSGNGRTFNPKMSQGVGNYITFTDKSDEDQGFYFQLKSENDHKLLAPFINAAIKLKRMTFKDGIDLVGIENVSI